MRLPPDSSPTWGLTRPEAESKIIIKKLFTVTLLTTSAFVGPSLGASVALASAQNVWHTYYYDYFYSEQSCDNRGYAMTTPGHSGYVPGIAAYYCYYTGPKWSMDVLD